jgi:lysophospholipase L1-like esterase
MRDRSSDQDTDMQPATILAYGDSLSWGIIPNTRQRLAHDRRWPGILEAALTASGEAVRVIEDCLNGRRTVWDDPYKPGRNGLKSLAQSIEAHSPVSVLIILLGTNDFQSMHAYTAFHSAQGIAALVEAARRAPIEAGMPVPRIIVVAPPPITEPKGPLAPKFLGAASKCAGLANAYREIATALDCSFVDSNTVTSASRIDGIHLDADQHGALGRALVNVVAPLLARA